MSITVAELFNQNTDLEKRLGARIRERLYRGYNIDRLLRASCNAARRADRRWHKVTGRVAQ